METAIERFAVLWFLVLGLAHILRPRAWTQFVILLHSKGEAGALICGIVCLALGALIVGFHPVWHGVPIVLTIFGWMQVAKAMWYFAFPQLSLRHMEKWIQKDSTLVNLIAGSIFVAIGALLGYAM